MLPSSSSSPAPRRPTGELPHCHLKLPHCHLELPHSHIELAQSHLELPHSPFAVLAGLCSIDTRRVARLAPLHTSSHLRYTEPTLTKFRQQRKALDASSEGSRPNLVNSKILKRGGSSIEIAP